MADQEQREEESRESDVTKFEQKTEDEREEREQVAEQLERDEPKPTDES